MLNPRHEVMFLYVTVKTTLDRTSNATKVGYVFR